MEASNEEKEVDLLKAIVGKPLMSITGLLNKSGKKYRIDRPSKVAPTDFMMNRIIIKVDKDNNIISAKTG